MKEMQGVHLKDIWSLHKSHQRHITT